MSMLALLFAVATPTTEAYELGRQIASSGMLATLGPLQAQAEVEDLVKAHPELNAEEQAKLRAIGEAESKKLGERVLDAEATAYAEALSVEDMRAIIAWQGSPAAVAQRKAMPVVIQTTMKLLGAVDFKGSVEAAMCSDSGRLCKD